MSNLFCREATIEDKDKITALFRTTIMEGTAAYYSMYERIAWAAGADIEENWLSRIREHYFLIAEIDAEMVGMASIMTNGYLDVIYVHPEYSGRGIATALLSEMERHCIASGNEHITSDVSRAAIAFFLKLGYQIVKPQLVYCRGVYLRNYAVTKLLVVADD